MAVAAAFGGVSPNFDPLYKEVTRLAKTLSIASARDIQNPGESFKLKIRDLATANSQPQTFDIYMKPYYAKEGDPVSYELYYKDGNNNEVAVTKGRYTTPPPNPPKLLNQAVVLDTDPGGTNIEYSINGQVIDLNNQLIVDINSGRIKFRRDNAAFGDGAFNANTAGAGDYVAGNSLNIELGIVKFEGATGLDVGLINDRISQMNLTIEALNKVLLVAGGTIDKALEITR